jgi:taurine dioxygenase
MLPQQLGLEVTGVDVTMLTDREVDECLSDLQAYGLIVYRRQLLDDAELQRFSRRIGPLEEPARTICHARDSRTIGYLTNLRDDAGRPLGFAGNSTDYWHSDQEYRQHPATLATLYCVLPSAEGGSTSFASTRVERLGLADDVLEALRALRATYVPASTHDNVVHGEVAHPAVLRQPGTGRETVYISANTRRLLGAAEADGARLKDTVTAAILRPENVYAHVWRIGDLALYDNAQLLHRRDAFAGLRWLKATKIFAPAERFSVPEGVICAGEQRRDGRSLATQG